MKRGMNPRPHRDTERQHRSFDVSCGKQVSWQMNLRERWPKSFLRKQDFVWPDAYVLQLVKRLPISVVEFRLELPLYSKSRSCMVSNMRHRGEVRIQLYL